MPEVKVWLIFISLRPKFHRRSVKLAYNHVKHVEKSCWKTDRTIDTKLDKFQIASEVKDNKDDNSEYSDSTKEEKDEQTVYSGCFPI